MRLIELLPLSLLALALPLRAAVLLDPMGRAEANWILPEGHGGDCMMAVQATGDPWLGCKGLLLEAPTGGMIFVASEKFSSVAWSGGRLAAIASGRLGTFDVLSAAQKKRTVSDADFVPTRRLPKGTTTLHTGLNGVLYAVVSGASGSELLALDPARDGVRLVFASSAKISAAAGDGRRTLVAFDGRIAAVTATSDSEPSVQALYEHPKLPITGLAVSPKLGIFYATPEGVSFLGERLRFELLRVKAPKIQAVGDALYVLPATGGVMKITGLDGLSDLDAAMVAKGVAPEERFLKKQRTPPPVVARKPAPEPAVVKAPEPAPAPAPAPAAPKALGGFKDD